MQNTSYSYKPKVQKDIRKYENATQILKKSSSKALNSSTPHAQERGNTNSPQGKANNQKSIKNYQNLLSQLDMNSNKDTKTYIQVNKILNPAKNDFLKQYLKNTLINSKKNKKDPETTQSSASKEQKSSAKDTVETKESVQREGPTYSKLDMMLGSIAGRLTATHKSGHIDRNDIMRSFVSPKGVATHSRANKSGIITSTLNKEGSETFTYKAINDAKDLISSKVSGRKSVENPYFYATTTTHESQRAVNPQKILAELDQNFNYTPTKIKRSATTKAREEPTNVLSQTLTRKAEDQRAKKFKFQEETNPGSIKLEEVELSPIRPAKRRTDDSDRRNRQIAQSQTTLDVNSQTNVNTSGELNLRKSQGLSKQEEKDVVNTSANNAQGSKKISVNQMNAHMYPTIVKQINLITANTPMAFGKPPLPNSSATPQNDVLKSANALNVQTVKESKRFEFPAYLNNLTCEHKRVKDSPSSSFTLDNSRAHLADKNKMSFTELVPEAYRQTHSGQRVSTDESRHYKAATEVSESPNILKGYKTEVPHQVGKYHVETSYVSSKQTSSPGKKGFGANFDTYERSKTPTADHARTNLHLTWNQIAPQTCKYTSSREAKGFVSSANHSFHNQDEVKRNTEAAGTQKDFFIPTKDGNAKNVLLNTNPASSEVSYHNNANNAGANYTGIVYPDSNAQKNEYEYRSSKDRENLRRNFSEEKENIPTENDGYRSSNVGSNHPGNQANYYYHQEKDKAHNYNDKAGNDANLAKQQQQPETKKTEGNANTEPNLTENSKSEKPKEVTILDHDAATRELQIMRFREEYIIGKQIGQGAYATVRLSIHKPTNRKVAIKVYEKQKIMDPMRRKSVRREIKLMQKMDHPNIIKIYDTFETNNHVHIVMEYMGGMSLHGFLKMQPNRRLSEERAYKLFRQVVAGIYYCHSRCIAHRDIKLENLLMDDNGNLKIIDFGFSTCIPNDKKVKMFCGTPSYMAPEIVLKKEYCGPPVDIWACGVLLYALLCGTFPFKGSNDKELYKRIVKGEFHIPEHISENASNLLLKMICVDPDKRLTAKEVMNDPWMLTNAFVEKRENLSINRKSQSVERVDISLETQEVTRPSNHQQPQNRNSNTNESQPTTIHINNYLKQYQNFDTSGANDITRQSMKSPSNITQIGFQSCKHTDTKFQFQGIPIGNPIRTPSASGHVKKQFIGDNNLQTAANNPVPKQATPLTTELPNRKSSKGTSSVQYPERTSQTPTGSNLTNNYFINNKNIIYNINLKDETPDNTDQNDTNIYQYDDFEPVDSRERTVKKIDRKSKNYSTGNVSPFKTTGSEIRNVCQKKLDLRSSYNEAGFEYNSSPRLSTNGTIHYDPEIIANMVKLGYKKEDIIDKLQDNKSTIYSIYKKLRNDKKALYQQVAPTHIPSVLNSIMSLNSHNLSGMGFVSPSHQNFKLFAKAAENMNTTLQGKSSGQLDTSGLSSKETRSKKGRGFLAERSGDQPQNDITETDITVKFSQNSYLLQK